MIRMFVLKPNAVYICFDLFLGECDEQRRKEISEDFKSKRPIHSIARRPNVCIMWRDERMDERVARQYSHMSNVDKGTRPFFFFDFANPPWRDEYT